MKGSRIGLFPEGRTYTNLRFVVCPSGGRLRRATTGHSGPARPVPGLASRSRCEDGMASYHLEAKIIGRSDGRSAIAAAAYRAGAVLTDPETGQQHDYGRKGGVVGAFILAPEAAPDWATDRAALWSAVHAKERRKNSQLAREIVLALPHELPEADAATLLRGWVERECVSLGMIADVAIHDPHPAPGRARNRHAHVMLTMRPLDTTQPDGWAKNKDRTWNDPASLDSWRSSWADAQNAALEAAAVAARVDHRSLRDQRTTAIEAGDDLLAMTLDRPPEPRLGLAATAIEKRAAQAGTSAPVTDRGRAVARSRTLRSRLLSALTTARDAGRVLADAVRGEPRRRRRDPIAALQAWRADHASKADSPAVRPNDDALDSTPDDTPDYPESENRAEEGPSGP